ERVLRRADEPGGRSEVDDDTALRACRRGLTQSRQRQLCAEKNAGQIDGAQAVPFLERRRFDVLAEKQTGIVNEDVEPPPAAEHGVDRGLPIRLARAIEVDIERRLAAPARRVPAALDEHIADPDLG